MANQHKVFGQNDVADGPGSYGKQREPAVGFINFSFPSQAGSGETRLGQNGLGMRPSKNTESYLHDMFLKSQKAGKIPEFNAWLAQNIICSYQDATPTGGADVDTARLTTPDFL
jgi:hypothetical protein